MNYWLIKSEEDTYSIDDMKKDETIDWFGIRNYQARNFMRNNMTLGDLVIFYHSNAKPSSAVGIVKVASLPHPDEKAFDEKHMYYDKRSTKEKPLWVCVDFTFVEKFKRAIALNEMKTDPELTDMLVTKKGQRLSIQPVEEKHFKRICTLSTM